MTEDYRKTNNYRLLMQVAYQKPQTGKDMWGLNDYSGLCHKEEGRSFINGSVEKLLQKSKAYLIKALDKLQKRREVPKEGKEKLEHLKARVELAHSSDGLDYIITEALQLTPTIKN